MKTKKLKFPRRSNISKQSLLKVRESENIHFRKHVSCKPPVKLHKHLYTQLENKLHSTIKNKNTCVGKYTTEKTLNVHPELENYGLQLQKQIQIYNLKANETDQINYSKLAANQSISSNVYKSSKVSSKTSVFEHQQQNKFVKNESNRNNQVENESFNRRKLAKSQTYLADLNETNGNASIQQNQKATSEQPVYVHFRNLSNKVKLRKRQALESGRQDYELLNRNSIIPAVDRNSIYCACTACTSAATLTYHKSFMNKLNSLRHVQLHNQHYTSSQQFVVQPKQVLQQQPWLISKVPIPTASHTNLNCYSNSFAENAKRLCLSHVKKSGEYSFSAKQNNIFLQGHGTNTSFAQRQSYHMLNSSCYESSLYNYVDYKQLVLNQTVVSKDSPKKLLQKNPVLYQWSTSSLESRYSESIQGSSGFFPQSSPDAKSILSNNFDYSTKNLFLQNNAVLV